jgi:endoglucanase
MTPTIPLAPVSAGLHVLWLAMAFAAVAASPAEAVRAVIRTGGPSFSGDAKRAVVLDKRRLVGKDFTVTDATGTVVLSGKLSSATGGAKPWRFAALADLSAITAPGSYQVTVGRLQSSPWVVAGDGSGTSTAVRHILRFFAMNSDGQEPSPIHGPSHLNDATIVGGSLDGQRVDLTGGWMDAGDTLKFTQTTSFAVVALLAAARLDPADAQPLVEAAGVGVRWLRKAHPAADVFVSQVGEIVSDHDRDPRDGFDPAADDASDVPAISHRQGLTGIGWDSGGRTAAALALAAQVAPDATTRDALVAAAREWYEAADRAGGLAPPLPEDPYPSDTGLDDMALGAVELYRASGDAQYLTDALDWIQGHEFTGSITWNDVGALAAAEFCGVLGAPAPSPAAATLGCSLLTAAAGQAAERAQRHALGTPGELAFGTTAEHGGAGAVLALADAAGFVSGRTFAADARDWVFGRNPWGRSFVAGLGPGAPVQIHHWAVPSGPAAFAGAVVGGPTTSQILREQRLRFKKGPFDGPAGFYQDRATNYVTSEVALDYAASTLLLLAALAPVI